MMMEREANSERRRMAICFLDPNILYPEIVLFPSHHGSILPEVIHWNGREESTGFADEGYFVSMDEFNAALARKSHYFRDFDPAKDASSFSFKSSEYQLVKVVNEQNCSLTEGRDFINSNFAAFCAKEDKSGLILDVYPSKPFRTALLQKDMSQIELDETTLLSQLNILKKRRLEIEEALKKL